MNQTYKVKVEIPKKNAYSYEIVIGCNLLEKAEVLIKNCTNAKKFLIVTNEKVEQLYGKDLKIKTQEQEVEDPTKDGIVLKQNKAPGEEVRKNSTVKVTIGVYEEKYVLENFLGKNIDVAINALESNNIKYEITYTETTECEDGIIISLTPEPGVTLEENSKVILEVAKNEENIKTPSENESSSQDESSEKPLEENKEDSSLN